MSLIYSIAIEDLFFFFFFFSHKRFIKLTLLVQIITVLSAPPEANLFPSWQYATAYTASLCPGEKTQVYIRICVVHFFLPRF